MKRTSCILIAVLLISEIVAPAQDRRRTSGATGASPGASEPAPQGDLETRVGDLSQQIAREMTDNQKRTIAVVEFVDLKGRVTDFGRFLAEELITRLYQTRKFKVIERQLLNKVVAEQKLSLTGVVDPSSAQKLGRLLGVDAIASGTVTDLGKTLKVNARLIDTTTAEVFAVASAEIFKDESVARLLGTGGADKARPGPADGTDGDEPSPRVADARGLTFELHQCKLSGTAVTCELTITSNGFDRELLLSTYESTDPPRLFDDSGNEFMVAQVQLGNRMGEQVKAVLVAGVHMKATLRFEGVQQSARSIKLLKIKGFVEGGGGGVAVVEFRDVSLSR
jgi:curli biogenesis system outer membrane secretion channel CsgG